MLVTDPEMTRQRGLVDTVMAAVAGGVTIVQLRDKEASDADLVLIGRALKLHLASMRVPLIVNDRPRVALAIGAEGVHLGESDGDPDEARALLGDDALIGRSATVVDPLATAALRSVNYIGLGPIFTTTTKPDAAAPLGVAGIVACRRQSLLPIVAIGGVHFGNLAEVIAAGASGIAVVSAICAAHDPRRAAVALRRGIEGALH
jgi:thiamine-phosphate pyrophosphorylase